MNAQFCGPGQAKKFVLQENEGKKEERDENK
jgi:hypothetical protein